MRNFLYTTFSIALAVFAIWLALQQRKESQQNYENTKSVLSEVEKVMEKTEMLVSENFQNLLRSMTDQQNQMLESLKPRPTAEEKYADLFTTLAKDEPEKLNAVVNAIARIQESQRPSDANPMLQLMQLARQSGGENTNPNSPPIS